MATYVFSDVHGHLVPLLRALDDASPASDDPIYVLGDMVDRGPDSVGVLKLCRSIEGATVLIFGAGDIGGHCAKRFAGFDAHIIGVCQNTAEPRPYFDQLCTLEEAEGFIPQADVIIGCIPNSNATAGYFDTRRLALCKPSAVLVNVGRGNFVNNIALEQAFSQVNSGVPPWTLPIPSRFPQTTPCGKTSAA